jgi:hypothetical protein
MTYQNESYGPQFLRFAWRPNWFWSVVLGAMFTMVLYFIARQPPFLYMGF